MKRLMQNKNTITILAIIFVIVIYLVLFKFTANNKSCYWSSKGIICIYYKVGEDKE